jgi:hypothetical protein
VHTVFLLTWAKQLYYEIKDTFRLKAPKVYLMICLCCRDKKLKQEQEIFLPKFLLFR